MQLLLVPPPSTLILMFCALFSFYFLFLGQAKHNPASGSLLVPFSLRGTFSSIPADSRGLMLQES